MPTKKIFRLAPDEREIWDEKEARAHLHLDGKQHEAYWNILKSDPQLILFGGGYYKYNLLQVMFNHPIIGSPEVSKKLVEIMK